MHINSEVAYQFGHVCRWFRNRSLQVDMAETMDETLFVVGMDDGKTLSVIGTKDVKYADA